MSESVIFEIQNLAKNFSGIKAVDDVSLTIKQGEIVFLVGPSGSGKSTFLRCLNFLEVPDSGTVLFHGKKIKKDGRELNWYRSRVGMVFQHFNLFPHLTIRKNITLAPVICGKMNQKEADLLANKLLARIGLADKANAYPAQLSGGQKQRVAIIRAMAMKPEVLLFDEPTSALDPEHIFLLMHILHEISKNTGILMVCHDLNLAWNFAKETIILKDSKIFLSGDTRKVLTSENIRKAFNCNAVINEEKGIILQPLN